jgi:hypothetical protein
MIKLRPEKSHWEQTNEKNKVYVRWLFIVLVFAYFVYLMKNGVSGEEGYFRYLNWGYIGALVIFHSIVNISITFFLMMVERGKWPMHPAVKYLSMTVDLLVVSLVLLPSGGEKSMFFLLYLVIVVSNTMRYGIKVGIVSLITLNIFYVGVLVILHYPVLVLPDMQSEILKIAGLWAVGIYLGYLSKRFEIMQGEVEKYQKIVMDLVREDED